MLAQAAPSGVLFLVQNDWCGDYQPGMRDAARLSGRNRDRLAAAQAVLAPGFQAAQARTGLMLLANYQAELEASRPNGMLAASPAADGSSRSSWTCSRRPNRFSASSSRRRTTSG